MNRYNYVRYLLLLGIILLLVPLSAQIQLGVDIDGEMPGDESGKDIAMSTDGNHVIIGAPVNAANGTTAGHARVYSWDGTAWQQIGADIDGVLAGDRAGSSVGISANGQRVAVGSPFNDDNGSNSGHVRIYELMAGNWVQLGTNIEGVLANDKIGWELALSDDGNRIALGAIEATGNSFYSGQVRVYDWLGSNWYQIGNTINGTGYEDNLGGALSFSSDAATLAIGARESSNDLGKVEIFRFNGMAWDKLGQDIIGTGINCYLGTSVSLSNDGNRVAIGASSCTNSNNSTSGLVRIYDFNGSTWSQAGTDIEGINGGGSRFGWSVSISGDGNRVAIGAFLSTNVNGSNAGNLQVYDFSNGTWTHVYDNIYGEAAGDHAGISVSLSDDGTRVAIGADSNDGNGINAGHARVFELVNCTNTSSIDAITSCGNYEWIDGITYSTSNDVATYTIPNASGCDSIISLDLTVNLATTSNITETSCDSYEWNGNTYASSGEYTFMTTNAIGCDSIATLNLTIINSSSANIIETSCNSYDWNGSTYMSSGLYTFATTNAVGCDSIATLDLTINNSSSTNIIETNCDSYDWNGNTYASSGQYTFTTTNAVGCDSIATLDLTIRNSSSANFIETGCGSYEWNGNIYVASGQYTFMTTNAVGCDSIATLDLSIVNINTNVLQGNDQLTADMFATAYQWIDCDNNQTIDGAIGQSFFPTSSGSYAVEITIGGCSSTSDCIDIILSSVKENSFPTEIKLHPNPVSDISYLDLGQIYDDVSLEVFDALGKRVYTQTLINEQIHSLDFSGYKSAVYFIHIKSENYGSEIIKLLKR